MGKLSKLLLNSVFLSSAHANNFGITNCNNDVSTWSWFAFSHSYWIFRELWLWKSIKITLNIILSTTVRTLWLHLMAFIRKPSLLTIYPFPMMIMASNRENCKNCNALSWELLGFTCFFRYHFESHYSDGSRHSIFNRFYFHKVILLNLSANRNTIVY